MNVQVADLQRPPRLKFIDMARSLAILLMLEGHFTGAALSQDYRKLEYFPYAIWYNVHGLTSPLFFTVTGLVFVYLLTANNTIPYFGNSRIKKGYKRVGMLLFWGYFIQLSFNSLFRDLFHGFKNVFNGDGWVFTFHFDWLQAFHVLQSIGVGIFFLLVIYGVYKMINIGGVYWYYLIGAIAIFSIHGLMKLHIEWDARLIEAGTLAADQKRYLPSGAPAFIQNMFYGKFSDFSWVRYAGYTVFGGMLGSLIRKFEHQTKEWWFSLIFIVTGVLIAAYIQPFFHHIDAMLRGMGLKGTWELNSTHFVRIGEVITLLGILMVIDARFDIKAKLFLKVGQNTLAIYIIHVIILYGGIFGFGLKPLAFNENLGPWAAVAISATAITFFVIMVNYIEPLEVFYSKAKNKLLFRKDHD